ncbi:DNA repair protein RecO [Marinicella gelatinilytica]|uniref:DNA repair protein RecO n=1 Tax=Marinicella gelatinilytica TaxID=2996017 RepID=UPI002260D922|nr:DNA repair protein RecO [Marinicella gelatinilytica]MCX7544620.1 DNA repair protein RecO [Marinicella gelatinilytica]
MVTDDAFVLHKIKYKNSSEIIKLLSKNHGRIDAVARGSRGAKSAFKGHLQPFIKTTISYQGKQTLKTLTQAEQTGLFSPSNYLNQVAMLYCNELLLLLNMDEEQSTAVYPEYQNLITHLNGAKSVSLYLRYFELTLCQLSGYALSIDNHIPDDTALVFQPDLGLVASQTDKNCHAGTFRQFIQKQTLNSEQINSINRLFRPVVNHLVGGRVIRSRELLQK